MRQRGNEYNSTARQTSSRKDQQTEQTQAKFKCNFSTLRTHDQYKEIAHHTTDTSQNIRWLTSDGKSNCSDGSNLNSTFLSSMYPEWEPSECIGFPLRVHFRIGTTEKNGQNTTNIFRLLLRIISVNMYVRKCILATIQPKNKLRSPTPGMTYRSLHLFPILTGWWRGTVVERRSLAGELSPVLRSTCG